MSSSHLLSKFKQTINTVHFPQFSCVPAPLALWHYTNMFIIIIIIIQADRFQPIDLRL